MKIKVVVLSLLISLTLTACGSTPTTTKNTSTIEVESPATKSPEASSETEVSEEQSAESILESINEQVLIDQDGLKITAKEMIDDSIWGKGIKLLIENNTDKNIGVGCNSVIINNYMISDLFSSSIAAGKKSNEDMYFSSTALDASGIGNIGQIEIYFHIFDSDSYETLFDTDCVTIQTSSYENMDTTALDDGEELLNQDGIRIVGKYVDEDSFWGKAVLLYIENNAGKNVGISCDNMSVNGFMVSPLFSSTVYDGKMAIDDITIMSSDLEENDIEKIEDIELQFHVYDADTYSTIFDTEPISFSVNAR